MMPILAFKVIWSGTTVKTWISSGSFSVNLDYVDLGSLTMSVGFFFSFLFWRAQMIFIGLRPRFSKKNCLMTFLYVYSVPKSITLNKF